MYRARPAQARGSKFQPPDHRGGLLNRQLVPLPGRQTHPANGLWPHIIQNLNVIFAPHDGGAAAVAAIVKPKGPTSKIMVFGVDGLPVMFKAIKAGDAVATMKQDNVRIGHETVDDALAIINSQTFNKTDLIPGLLIDKSDGAKYLPSPRRARSSSTAKMPKLSLLRMRLTGACASSIKS